MNAGLTSLYQTFRFFLITGIALSLTMTAGAAHAQSQQTLGMSQDDDSYWAGSRLYHEPGVNFVASHGTVPTPAAPSYKNRFMPGENLYLSAYLRDLTEASVVNFRLLHEGSEQLSAHKVVKVSSNFAWLVVPAEPIPQDALPGSWTWEVTYGSQTLRHQFWVAEPGTVFLDRFE